MVKETPKEIYTIQKEINDTVLKTLKSTSKSEILVSKVGGINSCQKNFILNILNFKKNIENKFFKFMFFRRTQPVGYQKQFPGIWMRRPLFR